MALAFLTGCEGTGRSATPTEPSLPSPPIVTGEITITSMVAEARNRRYLQLWSGKL